MNQEMVPCVYFPTTVVFVDDAGKFLEHVELRFGRKWLLKLYKNPEEALHFLKKKYRPDPFTSRCMYEPVDQDPDKRSIEIDIRAIRKEVYNPDRFEQIAVVILDYVMPILTGDALARQLKELPFKIILLTGEVDEDVAVTLFNQGVIHRYIRKDEPNFDVLLSQAIDELQHSYFQDLSMPILNSLAQSPDFPHAWFKESAFKNLLQQLCDDNGIVEYYLLDEFGSFLLFNEKADPSWLIVKNDKEMEGLRAHAEFENAPMEKVIKVLENRQAIPYFHTDKELQTLPAEWDKYFHPAKKLQGKHTYYYAYITDPKAYDIQPKKIISYQEYLK